VFKVQLANVAHQGCSYGLSQYRGGSRGTSNNCI